MSPIKDLTEKIVAFRDARDWKQFHNPKDQALSLLLEASELLEHFQWKNEEEAAAHINEHREAIGDELADILYWVLLMANDFDIDIEQSFLKKMEKNDSKYPEDKSYGKNTKYSEL